jgi:hypothetical protein
MASLRLAGLLVSTLAAQAAEPQDNWRDGYGFDVSEPGSDATNFDVAPGPPPAGTVKQTGESVDVWAAVKTLKRCGHIDVPDIPARAYVDNKGLTHVSQRCAAATRAPRAPH